MSAAERFPQPEQTVGVALVVATGRRGEIGRNGGLLFRLKADMAHFRTVTAGRPLMMGRKTWESFPKRPLPGRPNLVVTRNRDFRAPGASVWSGAPGALAAACAMAARSGIGEVCVVGGAEIYAACLPFATRLHLTEVDAEAEADVFFPAFDRSEWEEAASRRVEQDADNVASFTIRDLRRRR